MKSAEEIFEKVKSSFNAPSRKDEKVKVVVFCVLISTTFWFFSALNKSDYTTQVDYPIEFIYDDEVYVATKPLPRRLRIDVTGGGWDLMTRSFGFGMTPLRIRLENPSQANFQLTSPLRGQLSPLLEGLGLNFILADTLYYDIEPIVTRRLPIAFDSISVILEDNHRITSPIRIEPDSITLTGPESYVNIFPRTFIIYPEDDEVGEDVDEMVPVPDLGSPLVAADFTEVRTQFLVEEFMMYDENVFVSFMNVPDSLWRLEQDLVNVTYLKSERYTNIAFDTLSLALEVDFEKMNLADSTMPVDIRIRADYIIDLTIEPLRIKALYEER